MLNSGSDERRGNKCTPELEERKALATTHSIVGAKTIPRNGATIGMVFAPTIGINKTRSC